LKLQNHHPAQLSFQEAQKFDLGPTGENSSAWLWMPNDVTPLTSSAWRMRLRPTQPVQRVKIFETATTIWLYHNNPEALRDDFDARMLIPTHQS